MSHTIHDVGVAKQIGRYSDAIESAARLRWLHTSGTPGLSLAGELPADIEGQAEIAWTRNFNYEIRSGEHRILAEKIAA